MRVQGILGPLSPAKISLYRRLFSPDLSSVLGLTPGPQKGPEAGKDQQRPSALIKTPRARLLEETGDDRHDAESEDEEAEELRP